MTAYKQSKIQFATEAMPVSINWKIVNRLLKTAFTGAGVAERSKAAGCSGYRQ